MCWTGYFLFCSCFAFNSCSGWLHRQLWMDYINSAENLKRWWHCSRCKSVYNTLYDLSAYMDISFMPDIKIMIFSENVNHIKYKTIQAWVFRFDSFMTQRRRMNPDTNCGTQTLMVLKYPHMLCELCVTDAAVAPTADGADRRPNQQPNTPNLLSVDFETLAPFPFTSCGIFPSRLSSCASLCISPPAPHSLKPLRLFYSRTPKLCWSFEEQKDAALWLYL